MEPITIVAIVCVVLLYIAALASGRQPDEIFWSLVITFLAAWVLLYFIWQGAKSLLQAVLGI